LTQTYKTKFLKLETLKQHLETILSELDFSIKELYYQKNQLRFDVVTSLKYLEDLEHIFGTGKNVLNCFLQEIARINKVRDKQGKIY